MKSALCKLKICTLQNEICTLWNEICTLWNETHNYSVICYEKLLWRSFSEPNRDHDTHFSFLSRPASPWSLENTDLETWDRRQKEFFTAFVARIASTKLALSIALSPQLLSAPGGPALLCFATRWFHTRLHATRLHNPNNAWQKCTMKERDIWIHFLPCFADPTSSCKNNKHLVTNSSLEVCVIHSQFCVFDTRFKTKMS